MAASYTKRSDCANRRVQNLLLQAARTFPTCSRPVGLGAKRTTTGIMGLVTMVQWWVKRASSKEAPFVCIPVVCIQE
jgi:hypothetical protein